MSIAEMLNALRLAEREMIAARVRLRDGTDAVRHADKVAAIERLRDAMDALAAAREYIATVARDVRHA